MADLVTFTEEISSEKLRIFCSVSKIKSQGLGIEAEVRVP